MVAGVQWTTEAATSSPPSVNRNKASSRSAREGKKLTTPQQNERFRRLADKQRAVDAKLARWFGIPALATEEVWGDLETIILSFSESRPASLRRLLRSHGPRLRRAVGGAEETDFIAATVIGEDDPIRLPSHRFVSETDAFLSGFGPGVAPVRDGLVRFAHGTVTVNMVGFSRDENWGLYCLSSEKDPAEAEHLEVFALRWGGSTRFGY